MSIYTPPPQPELIPELNFSFPGSSCNNFDYFLDPIDQFYFDEHYNSLNPTDPFLLNQEPEPFHYSKRQKPEEFIFSNNQLNFNQHALFNEVLVPNPCLYLQENYSFPEITVTPPLPNFQTGPPIYNNGSCMKKQSVSPQSIAARQRRKKITEKTQELGKLIPGSQKLNTAEMFQSAYKYIKYLQAQVGILEFMGSYNQENEEKFHSEELNGLVESPLVQEKLYLTENCLVPRKFVKELGLDHEMLKTKPEVLKEIFTLMN